MEPPDPPVVSLRLHAALRSTVAGREFVQTCYYSSQFVSGLKPQSMCVPAGSAALPEDAGTSAPPLPSPSMSEIDRRGPDSARKSPAATRRLQLHERDCPENGPPRGEGQTPPGQHPSATPARFGVGSVVSRGPHESLLGCSDLADRAEPPPGTGHTGDVTHTAPEFGGEFVTV